MPSANALVELARDSLLTTTTSQVMYEDFCAALATMYLVTCEMMWISLEESLGISLIPQRSR